MREKLKKCRFYVEKIHKNDSKLFLILYSYNLVL